MKTKRTTCITLAFMLLLLTAMPIFAAGHISESREFCCDDIDIAIPYDTTHLIPYLEDFMAAARTNTANNSNNRNVVFSCCSARYSEIPYDASYLMPYAIAMYEAAQNFNSFRNNDVDPLHVCEIERVEIRYDPHRTTMWCVRCNRMAQVSGVLVITWNRCKICHKHMGGDGSIFMPRSWDCSHG